MLSFIFYIFFDIVCALYSWVTTLSHSLCTHSLFNRSHQMRTLTIWFRWSYWIDWPSLWMRKMLWLPDSHLVLRFLNFRLCHTAHIRSLTHVHSTHTHRHFTLYHLILCCFGIWNVAACSSIHTVCVRCTISEWMRKRELVVSASASARWITCVRVLLCLHFQSNPIRSSIHSLSFRVCVCDCISLDFDVFSLFAFHALSFTYAAFVESMCWTWM